MIPEAEPAARRQRAVNRAFIVHLVAYSVALPWAIAVLPLVFTWKEAELLAMDDETDAAWRVVRWSLLPAGMACLIAHLPGVPWVLAARRGALGGRALYVGATATLVLAGGITAAVTWSRLLAR